MGIGSSLHTVFGWQGQYDRLLRWHQRIAEYPVTKPSSPEADEYLDFVLAFFLNCFALKDWLRNANVVDGNEVDKFVHSDPDLQICRDICNGSKHYKITTPSIDDSFSIVREVVPDPHFGEFAYPGPRLVIYAGENQHDILELAKSCIDAWRNFLQERGLIDG